MSVCLTSDVAAIERGVIYVALGERFFVEACTSARSLRRFMPAIPITLFTDQADRLTLFTDTVPLERSAAGPFRDKLLCMARSPYDQTLFLDTDTYVCADVSELFDLLDQFDLGLTHDRAYKDYFPPDVGVPPAFREFNTGVAVYRKSPDVDRFFSECLRWYNHFASASGAARVLPDQLPFRIAAYHSRLRIATLTFEYNCRFPHFGYVNGKVKILHGRAPLSSGGEEQMEKAAAALNAVEIPRVYVAGEVYALSKRSPRLPPAFACRHVARCFASYWRRCLCYGLDSIRRRGIVETGSLVLRIFLKRPVRRAAKD